MALTPSVRMPGRRARLRRAALDGRTRLRLGRRLRWTPARRRTAAIGVTAAASALGAFVVELSRVWRRGSAPLPAEADNVFEAAVEAAVETTEVALAGYQAASAKENALFNLFASFVISSVASRAIAFALRSRRRVGPFRNVKWRRRHIHHFVPGIVLAFVSGAVAIVSRDERLEPKLAVLFGTGMGMTMDESALLLELDDVYWTEEGLVSVQITLALVALLGALAMGMRFMRRGEERVLPPAATNGRPGLAL